MPRFLTILLSALLPALASAVMYQEPLYSVAVEKDVVYGAGAVDETTTPGSIDLLLDVYRPVGADAPDKPAMLLVHGGSFRGGSKSDGQMQEAAQYFASRGWVCFSIDYRLEGDDPPAPQSKPADRCSNGGVFPGQDSGTESSLWA